MKVMVFDVPAESGGALTVLNQYYEDAVNDLSNEWIFVVSTPKYDDRSNLKVLNYPWIKKSWFHRVYFDIFVAPKLVKEYNIEEVLSLQNIIIPKLKVKQTLYLHQALPFSEKSFRLIKNFKFWVYQNIISKVIYNSIIKADKIIVQTRWIREAAIKKTGVSKEKFIIKQPKLNIEVRDKYDFSNDSAKLFFYPASEYNYKNHELIVKACLILKKKNIKNYRIIFTLSGDENKYSKKIKEISVSNDLPIEFIGLIDKREVYEYYSKSILIFPSYIETFGLPLLEAKMHESPILASDCEFSHEILNGYSKAKFFNPNEPDELVYYLDKILTSH